MRQTGIFYGIGVGPGDPELMTLKAVRTIRDCDVIVLPVSNRELTEPLLLEQNEMENRAAGYLESCTAYQIAVQTVSELKEKQILFLPMPMIKDKEKLRKIHARGAEVIEQFLEKGWNLAFLTLEVRASNYPAIALYGSRGFRGVGRRKNYYEHPREDAIIMTREFEQHGTENPVS